MHRIGVSFAICFLLLAAAGVAETAPVPEITTNSTGNLTEDETAVKSRPASARGTVTLDAVMVTAGKREDDVQDIPASISVIDHTQVRDYGVQNSMDIAALAPNLYVTQNGNFMMTSFAAMRGIVGAMTQTPAVGLYVDDVYYTGLDISLLDVERIEVLRGPQGTLYGRNSEAGVINVVTRRPSDVWEAELDLTGGSFESYGGTGSVSGPIVDDLLKFKAAVRYFETDGYFENRFDDSKDGGRMEKTDARFSMEFTPTDDLDMLLTYDLERYYSPKNAQFAPLDQDDLRKNVDVNYDGDSKKDADGVSLRAEYAMDAMRLVSISALRRESFDSSNDLDTTPLDLMTMTLDKDVTSFSQELRLASDTVDSDFRWLGGLFFLSEKDERQYDTWMNFRNMGMPMPGEWLAQKSTTETIGLAAFGEASYAFAKDFDLTLGLRYDWENKTFDYSQEPGGRVLSMMGYEAEDGSEDDVFDAWLPKASLSYKVTEQIMPYASVARGFRSGGFNSKQQMGTAYKPEFTWNYELGAKTSWFDNRLQVNAALFYIDWTDMQVEVPVPGGSSVSIENAGKASSKGAELELIARPVAGLELIASAAHTYAVYDDYTQGTEVFDGNRVINSPDYTLNFGATYRFAGGFFVNAGYTHFGEVYFDPANTASQSEYGLVNAKIGYESDHFDIYLFGRNLFDEEYATRAYKMSGTWYGRAGEPLTLGLMLSTRF